MEGKAPVIKETEQEAPDKNANVIVIATEADNPDLACGIQENNSGTKEFKVSSEIEHSEVAVCEQNLLLLDQNGNITRQETEAVASTLDVTHNDASRVDVVSTRFAVVTKDSIASTPVDIAKPRVDIAAPEIDVVAPRVDIESLGVNIAALGVDVNALQVEIAALGIDVAAVHMEASQVEEDEAVPRVVMDAPLVDEAAQRVDVNAPLVDETAQLADMEVRRDDEAIPRDEIDIIHQEVNVDDQPEIADNLESDSVAQSRRRRARQEEPKRVVSVHFECQCRDEDLARMRAELRDDPSQLDGGVDCCPPLLHAVIKEHVRCVIFLLQQGALVNKEYTPLGETPLSSAVTRSTPEIARLLLERDSSGVNARSSLTHEPPLVRAVKHGNVEIVRMLLAHGARPDACAVRNEESIPCVYLAIELGYQEVVALLLDRGASLHGHEHFDKHNQLYKHLQFVLAEGQMTSLKALCLHGALRELAKLTLYPNLQLSIHCNFPLLCVLFRNNNSLEVNLRMLDMLYEFGFNFWKCDRHDKNTWKKLEKLDTNEFAKLLIYKVRRMRSRPLSLKSICRIKMQDIMGKHYVTNVSELQIPGTLYSFLRFEYV